MEHKTALYDRHVELGGKMVPFAGYMLPVQFKKGILEEHMIVREHVGMFDCSHMGEARLDGPDALKNVNNLFSNSFDSMKDGSCRYSIMLYEDGGCIDDLIVYRRSQDSYYVIINASNAAKDVGWIRDHLIGDVKLTDMCDGYSQIAVQGPEALKMNSIISGSPLPEKYYTFTEHVIIAGVDCFISRTGYTGSFGYELFMPNEGAVAVWNALLEIGVEPCGLGSRDTLRTEAALPLYGHEITEVIDPLTAGLNFAVKMDKPDFIGKSGLVKRGTPTKKRVGIKVVGRGVIRDHQDVYDGDKLVGFVSSGTFMAWINASAGMAFVEPDVAVEGKRLEVDVRGRRVPVEVVPLPFYNTAREVPVLK
ncbi:glycine cleavage system aminomethyltransferase GcvT [Cloacibacillus evryensis]|uniref:glycine cleavage system aminomethyltransferase GcvT n=1 Tax=Cloacibacillus evryensis TaxID=508460 RepID=UPI00045197CC|nr:glycine cleavage system aminomethyltransferase GcvT [Cloacibacillus evryensis]EXG78924.1 glycine cleavage system T protein [Cloacibacillus evryensis DSM 19522]MEA5036206.1 glycine cleavage system aminomethyltransferase GcvT [Cloacibacillus evryensis]